MKRIISILIIAITISTSQAKVDLVTLAHTRHRPAYNLQFRRHDPRPRKQGPDTQRRKKQPPVLLGQHPHRPDQPRNAAQGLRRQNRHRRISLPRPRTESRPLEHPKCCQRKSPRRNFIPHQRPFLARFYMGTLTQDEKTMRLQGYVRLTNNSGEDYENAQTRLIVGKVHILDEIAELARRQYPYGRPGEVVPLEGEEPPGISGRMRMAKRSMMVAAPASSEFAYRPKQIIKEGLSEYFLYTIEGTETVSNGWSKRLQSFDIADVPVINLYKYEEERYGPSVLRFLSFKNDKKHKLGQTPIPGGDIKSLSRHRRKRPSLLRGTIRLQVHSRR